MRKGKVTVNLYTDLQLLDRKWIERQLSEESWKQITKWGVQEHSAFKWLTILVEEVGSLAKAILEHEFLYFSTRGKLTVDKEVGRLRARVNVIDEATQVATLAMKIAEMHKIQKLREGVKK